MRVAVSILKLEPACGYTQGSPGIDLVDLDGFEPSTPRCKRSIFPIILQAHVWCSVSDSNRPPTHYKCVALPNELTELFQYTTFLPSSWNIVAFMNLFVRCTVCNPHRTILRIFITEIRLVRIFFVFAAPFCRFRSKPIPILFHYI